MSSRRLFGLAWLAFAALLNLGAAPFRVLPGAAHPYAPTHRAPDTPWTRLDALSRVARQVPRTGNDWTQIAKELTTAALPLSPLSAMDRYWLGSSWWANHQPAIHLRQPSWAVATRWDAQLPLEHPEGGNCETSANGHVALLNAMGVPSLPVYGYHLRAKEGHVWVASDIDGQPIFSDVHVARGYQDAWHPRPEDVMNTPGFAPAATFAETHLPDRREMTGLKTMREAPYRLR